MNKEKLLKRDANLDLLRVISMLLIILLHSIDHSGVLEALDTSSIGLQFIEYYFYSICQVCVNCFVMLSGYYLVKSTFRISKLITLWIEVVFYALIFKVIFMATGGIPFSLKSLVSCFLPVITGRYWFVTIYFGLYLVSPFLNKMINSLTERDLKQFNILLFILFSVMNSIHPSFKGMNSGGGWGLAWFVVLYFIVAWIRLYDKSDVRPIKYALVFFLVPLIIVIGLLVVRKLGIGLLNTMVYNLYRYDSVTSVICSISLFMWMKNISIKNKMIHIIISQASILTFGVYLIHAHANVNDWLWALAALPSKMTGLMFPLLQIGLVIVVFIVCVFIDYVRSYLFQMIHINK